VGTINKILLELQQSTAKLIEMSGESTFSSVSSLVSKYYLIEIGIFIILWIITVNRRKLSSNDEYRKNNAESTDVKQKRAHGNKVNIEKEKKHTSSAPIVAATDKPAICLSNFSTEVNINIMTYLTNHDIFSLMASSKRMYVDLSSDFIWEQMWIQTYAVMWQHPEIRKIRESRGIFWDPMQNFGHPHQGWFRFFFLFEVSWMDMLLAGYCTQSRCLVGLHNTTIADVTSFVESHPGSPETLTEGAGCDASEAFGEIGHSSYAEALVNSLSVWNSTCREWQDACCCVPCRRGTQGEALSGNTSVNGGGNGINGGSASSSSASIQQHGGGGTNSPFTSSAGVSGLNGTGSSTATAATTTTTAPRRFVQCQGWQRLRSRAPPGPTRLTQHMKQIQKKVVALATAKHKEAVKAAQEAASEPEIHFDDFSCVIPLLDDAAATLNDLGEYDDYDRDHDNLNAADVDTAQDETGYIAASVFSPSKALTSIIDNMYDEFIALKNAALLEKGSGSGSVEGGGGGGGEGAASKNKRGLHHGSTSTVAAHFGLAQQMVPGLQGYFLCDNPQDHVGHPKAFFDPFTEEWTAWWSCCGQGQILIESAAARSYSTNSTYSNSAGGSGAGAGPPSNSSPGHALKRKTRSLFS
jgi:hypothetical protein